MRSIGSVRDDYPILQEVTYLDSAATSLTPEAVVSSTVQYYREYNANIGRGVYRLSQIASQRYREAHRKVAGFIGAGEEEVIFTKNTTESTNAVAYGIAWKKGDRIVTTLLEHHSNLLPWMRLRRAGVDLKAIEPNEDGVLVPSSFDDAIDEGTRLVAVTQASNVLGSISPLEDIASICRERGSLLLVDGAQAVPHMPTDVKRLGCDFLCFSGHKMLGPKGTGVLWMRGKEIEPLLLGGGAVEDVSLEGYSLKDGYEGFEAGTQNIPGGIGLGAAVDYLSGLGLEEVRAHELMLTDKILEGLQEIDGVQVYGPPEAKDRVGLVSFNIEGISPHEVAMMLDESSEIAVRSGHHCCTPLMKHLGLYEGTVRASIYLYNNQEDVEKLLTSVEEIVRAMV